MNHLSSSRITYYVSVLLTLFFLTANGIVSAEVLSAGWTHTCAVKSGGTIICWGQNDFGKSTSPSGQFKSVSAGNNHTCGVKTDNTVACWGGNNSGQTNAPGGEFQSVSAGYGYTCGIKADATIVCWGTNFFGEANAPSGQFESIDIGLRQGCGLKVDNTLACWGIDKYPPIGPFQEVIVGDGSRLCGIKADDSVTCWSSSLTLPSGQFKSVSAGSVHICGIKTNNTIVCVGDDSEGQVTPPTDQFKSISAGSKHNCGLKTDGTVVCWGLNNFGQATPPEGLTLITDDSTGGDDGGQTGGGDDGGQTGGGDDGGQTGGNDDVVVDLSKCDPALYSTSTKKLTFEEVVMELYNPLTDEATGEFALFSGDEMSFKALTGFYNFQYKGGNPTYADQIIIASENCYPTYSAQQRTVHFPQVKVPLISILPNEVVLDGPAACYEVMLTQSITQPNNFALTQVEELICQ